MRLIVTILYGSGRDRGSVAHRDAEARSRPRTTESPTIRLGKTIYFGKTKGRMGPAK
jgi:hypothetical protein